MSTTDSVPASPQMYDFEKEDLIDIFFDKPKGGHGHGGRKEDVTFYEHVVEKSASAFSYVPVEAANALRRLYPKHSLVMTQQFGVLGFPGLTVEPLERTPLITNLYFIPLSKRLVGVPGLLLDQVEFGAFNVRWNSYDFIVYTITFPAGFGTAHQHFILHEGPEEASRLLLLSVGTYLTETHDEIWVFNQGFWDKDANLYREVQKANWDDVILKEEFKDALQKDVYGFFSSEKVYKDLGIAWKRGLIMYGPPGNGKTISIKAIMKSCGDMGFQPLYVKSFQSWMGEEASMAAVFNKARQLAPCIVVLEDLDSLINDGNRSFFLNQVDGIEGNDGLLLIGTTNHFERLDPGLSTRPSRFDRKYKFDDPDYDERVLYVKYWQTKLEGNETVEFPESLVKEVAELTDQFSFAYLKEAFVSTLVTLATWEGDKPSFGSLIKAEIKTLRKQLDKSVGYDYIQRGDTNPESTPKPVRPPRPNPSKERDIRSILDALSESSPAADPSQRRFFSDTYRDRNPWTRRPTPEEVRKNRDIRALLDALADHLDASDISSFRHYESPPPREYQQRDDFGERRREGDDYRGLFNRMSERDRDMRLFDLQQHTRRMPPRHSAPFFGSTEEPDWNTSRPSANTSASTFNPLPQVPRPDLA